MFARSPSLSLAQTLEFPSFKQMRRGDRSNREQLVLDKVGLVCGVSTWWDGSSGDGDDHQSSQSLKLQELKSLFQRSQNTNRLSVTSKGSCFLIRLPSYHRVVKLARWSFENITRGGNILCIIIEKLFHCLQYYNYMSFITERCCGGWKGRTTLFAPHPTIHG